MKLKKRPIFLEITKNSFFAIILIEHPPATPGSGVKYNPQLSLQISWVKGHLF